MTTDIEKLWHASFDQCSAFVRDTTLPQGFLQKYRVGLLLREPTFCDASYKLGGFVAPHRFLIISSHAKCLDDVAPQPWGLCVWQTGTFFKVIDNTVGQGRAQVTLLEIPAELVSLFTGDNLSELEHSFALQARQAFEQYLNAAPIPELNTEEWRQRLIYPIGINAQGEPFPRCNEIEPESSDGPSLEIVGSSPTNIGDEIKVVDAVRRGDIVWFDRISA